MCVQTITLDLLYVRKGQDTGNFVDGEGYPELLNHLEPDYQIPSRANSRVENRQKKEELKATLATGWLLQLIVGLH